MAPRSHFIGGQLPGDWEEIHASLQEMIARQAQTRNDAVERALLESLAHGTCGVLVVSTADGERIEMDDRVPYATIAYFPHGMADPHGLFPVEPAPTRTLHLLLRHLARRLLER